MTKTKWTIWRIKNRWLRTAAAWPLAIVVVIVLTAISVGATVVFAIKGVCDGFADVVDAKERQDWADIGAAAWAALSGKDEPA